MRKETVSIFEPGDVVLFQTGENGLKSNIGMILKHKENGNYAILSVYSSAYKDVKPSWIASVNDVENIRNEITSHYEENISELQSKIRKPTQEEKESEKVEKYDKLKKQIIATARNMIDYKDDCDFENKLKAIADMKREIFQLNWNVYQILEKKTEELSGRLEKKNLIEITY